MPFRFADAILELPDDLVAGDVIVAGHSDTTSFEYEPSVMIQQVRTKAIAPRKDGNVGVDSLALGGLRGSTGAMVLLDPDDPQLFGGGPAASTAAIGYDLISDISICSGICLSRHSYDQVSCRNEGPFR